MANRHLDGQHRYKILSCETLFEKDLHPKQHIKCSDYVKIQINDKNVVILNAQSIRGQRN